MASTAEGGFADFLTVAKLNTAEFGICCAFWVGLFVVSSFIGLEEILSELRHHSKALLFRSNAIHTHGRTLPTASQALVRSRSSSMALGPRRATRRWCWRSWASLR